jgi:hypothetical protein
VSDQPPWAYRGAFIPFFRPVPAITDDPLSPADVRLCFSEAWTPAVLGALKVLCRPETWTGTESDIQTAMLNAQLLLQALQDGCEASDLPWFCQGNVQSTASPFGTWTLGCMGQFLGAGIGYNQTVGLCGGYWYNGVDLDITLDSPIVVTDIAVHYNRFTDSIHPDPATYQFFVVDLVHGSTFSPEIPGGSITDGIDKIIHTGPSALGPSDHFRVFLAAGANGGSWSATGTVEIDQIDFSGTSASNPCSTA